MEGNFALLFLIFFPIFGGFISYLIGRFNKKMRDYFAVFVAVVEFIVIITLMPYLSDAPAAAARWFDFAGLGLNFTIDGFRYIYGIVTTFMWWVQLCFQWNTLKATEIGIDIIYLCL